MAVATERRTDLRCPRCGSRLAPDQDWCLACGAAATTQVVGPPSWKLAVATVLGVVAAVAVGAVLLATSLSSDSDNASQRAAAVPAAPPPEASTAPPPAATPPASTTPPATGTTTSPPTTTSKAPAASLGGEGVRTWPSGKRGWTVVLGTEVEQSTARSRAKSYSDKGVKAGVLDATKYTFSTPTGAFVIFFGEFDSQSEAVTASSNLADKLPATAYVTSVTPR
jgi:hypothetical protein